jgi:outer membrane receptor protein involved in Fe transport
MKTQASYLVSLCVAVLLTASVAGQTSPTTGPAAPSASEKEDVLVLSPFEVTGENNNGYAASNTLAGTRLRTDLKDVAASIQVVTKEFMQDIGANTLDDLLVYTVGTEAAGIGGNYSDSSANADTVSAFGSIRSPQGSNRVRGLGSADQTRDYFITSLPTDGYNIDRVEVNRGPNSMLFGLGSPAGIINTGLIKALTNNTKTKLEAQFDQNGSSRATLDHNQVLIKDNLALRVAALYGDKRYQQEPAYVRDARFYGTVTWKPWNSGTLKLSAESAKQHSNKVQTQPPHDQFTWWFALGKPVYDPTTGLGSYLGTPPTDPNLRAINTNGSANGNLLSTWSGTPNLIMEDPNVTKFGVTGLDPAIWAIEGNNNRVRLNPAGTAFANDAMRRLQAGKNYLQRINLTVSPALNNFWRDFRITDPAIFNFYDEMLEGPNKREWSFWKSYNLSFEQRLGGNAGIEIAFDKQSLDSGYVNPFDFRSHAINIDINTKLPNGLPNPNLGRPMVTGASFQSSGYTDREAFRATAYYNLNLQKILKPGWLGTLLGRHVFTGAYTGQKRFSSGYGGRAYYAGYDWWQADSLNDPRTIDVGSNRTIQRLTYVGPSLVGASSPVNAGVQSIRVHNGLDGIQNLTTLFYQTPPTSTVALAPWQTRTFSVIQGTKYDLSNNATFTSRNGEDIKSTVFVANSYWWDNTLVSTLGWRNDAFKTFDAGAPPIDPASGLRILTDAAWPNRLRIDSSASSFNYGAVLHEPPFLRGKLPWGANLSLTYNKSDNFKVSGQRVDLFNQSISPPTGTTKEYGIILTLLDGRLDLRATKYETSSALSTNTAFRELTNQLVRRLDDQIELNSNAAYQAVAPAAALSAWTQWQQGADAKQLMETFTFSFAPGPNGTTIVNHDDRIDIVAQTSDTVATGTEYDLTYNPTKNWRIALNAARQQAVLSNTASSYQKMITILDPVWGGSAAALPDSVTSTSTLGNQWGTIKANVQKQILLDGSSNPEVRKWRFNLVNNYTFSSGRLSGLNIGGAIRWQDKVAIGYPVTILADGSAQYDVTRPYFGPAETNYDAWVGYRRKIGQNMTWRIQLNVRSIGVGNELIPISAQIDGTYDSVRIAEPQTWSITNTLEF